MRSLLFLPGDDERKIAKALGSAADALILDLEDAVAPQRKAAAREVCAAVLRTAQTPKALFVRVNALDTADHAHDLKAVAGAKPFGIVLPKCRHGSDVRQLGNALDALEAQDAIERGTIRILPIVTETAASLFGLLSYRDCCSSLVAMSWGAEDLSAALGASSKYAPGGELAFTYKLARSLCLAGAVAAEVQPVDGVFADFRDEAGLIAEARAAASEGFTGKLAIHPAQVGPINAAFTPTVEEIDHARAIVAAFEAEPDAGVLSVDGKMVDWPHLIQARRVLARSR